MPKISELNAITSVTNDDLMMVVNDPAGAPTTNKITIGNFFSNVNATAVFSNNVTFSKGITISNTTLSNVTLSNTTISNATLIFSISNVSAGANNSANSTNYKTVATKLDVNTSIQYLFANSTSYNYHLPAGSNGQIMYFAAKSSTAMDNTYIWVDNLRSYNSYNSNTFWKPFTVIWARSFATACYIDGAWNIDAATV
jgi:hypothetical protein